MKEYKVNIKYIQKLIERLTGDDVRGYSLVDVSYDGSSVIFTFAEEEEDKYEVEFISDEEEDEEEV